MACIYIYKNHTFESELDLDNFLLEKQPYESQYGDMVFSIDQAAIDNDKILNDLLTKNNDAFDLYAELKRKKLLYRDEFGDYCIKKEAGKKFRYMGVNAFLSKLYQDGGIKDDLLFPHVDMDNYFVDLRFPAWASGDFTEDEINLLFPGENPQPITDPTEQNNARQKIEEKWNALGRCGDIIHTIFEVFFSNQVDDSGNIIRDKNNTILKVFSLKETELLDYIKKKISNNEHYKWLEHLGSIEDNLRSVVSQALKILKAIENQVGCKANEMFFYPEYIIKGTAIDTRNNQPTDLFGIVDLLVMDNTGRLHIFDYKTSIKEYNDFDSAKRKTYSYLLSMYKLMFENEGFPTSEVDVNIIPIKIENFGFNGTNFEFNGVTFDEIKDISNASATIKAEDLIEYMMPSKYAFKISVDDLHKNIIDFDTKCFSGISIELEITEESIKRLLDNREVFKKKNENGEFEYFYQDDDGKIKTVKSKTEDDMIKLVLDIHTKILPKRLKTTGKFKSALKKGISEETSNVEFPRTYSNKKGSATKIQDIMIPYCTKEWEIIDNDKLEYYGIITLFNKNTRQIDYIRISTNNLHRNYHEKITDKEDKRHNRKSLLSNFETDAQAELKYKRNTLEGVIGNLELMEMMMAINSTKGLDRNIIGKLLVINPYQGQIIDASNESLLTNFNTLCKYASITNNRFNSGDIKMASKYDLLEDELTTIWTKLERLGEDGWKDSSKKLKLFKSCKSEIDTAARGSEEDKIKAVLKLIKEMNIKLKDDKINSHDLTELSYLLKDYVRVYNSALLALAELKGINFRLLIKDHDYWFSSLGKAFSEGVSGNMIDNPGNLDSETLNLITTLTKEAFQNTRDEIQREKAKLDKIIRELKKAIGFDYLKENIGFNQALLYEPLYKIVDNNGVPDLHFKTVEELKQTHPLYVPLLEYMLETINSRRLAGEDLEQLAEDGDPRYYQVPLAKGGLDSQVSARGMLNVLKNKLKALDPRNWKERLMNDEKSIQGLGYKEKRAKNRLEQSLIYQMENMFDRGESDRLEALQDAKGNNLGNGIDYIERNAETLVLKHIFAYALLKNIDEIFPLIQSAAVHLNLQGANAGKEFTSDKKYLDNYIRNKIKNESIVDPNLTYASKLIGKIKSAASKLTLAVTPVLMFYQPIQGLWTDIRLAIQRPDGKLAFTFTHFKISIKLLAEDLFNFSGKPTLLSKINELYALNDMDINKYIDNITHNKKGLLYNTNNMMYKFASRPDYYNRLAIFLSLMQGDGCLEAHSIVDGKLVYDWKKDKRFSKFAADPKNKNNRDPEYLKLKALYYAIAKLFVNENVTDENGDPFILDMNDPKPLPKAYTSKQAEGYKSVADDIYGYYSNENKSLIQSTAFGAMWLQFKTFWSGKKNLYLQSGGIRMRGSWEPWVEIEKDENGQPILDENGNLKKIEYFYALDENGDIDYNKIVKKDELPPEKQLAPVMYWKGLWQEGIAVTMALLVNKGLILRNYRRMMSEDPDMARCYRSNMIQLGYDMVLWSVCGVFLGGILSGWLKDLLSENKDNDDFLTGCQLTAANIAVRSVKNSFIDFNIFDSLGSPLALWTPFAISFTSSTIKNLGKYVTGDLDIWDTIVLTNGFARLTKPLWNSLKPEQYRTKAEGGTWESRTAINNREK